MASPEFPHPEEQQKKLKDLSHAEFLSNINQISEDVKQDREARNKERVMREKIAARRKELGGRSDEFTDEEIRGILESEERDRHMN